MTDRASFVYDERNPILSHYIQLDGYDTDPKERECIWRIWSRLGRRAGGGQEGPGRPGRTKRVNGSNFCSGFRSIRWHFFCKINEVD